MEQFLNTIKDLCEQAYFYIPTILAFITSVGIPALIKISNIVNNSKAMLEKTETFESGLDVAIDTVQGTLDVILVDKNAEIQELELEKQYCFNPKQKELIDSKIARIKKFIEDYKDMKVSDIVKKAVENSKKVVKVKVRKVKSK